MNTLTSVPWWGWLAAFLVLAVGITTSVVALIRGLDRALDALREQERDDV